MPFVGFLLPWRSLTVIFRFPGGLRCARGNGFTGPGNAAQGRSLEVMGGYGEDVERLAVAVPGAGKMEIAGGQLQSLTVMRRSKKHIDGERYILEILFIPAILVKTIDSHWKEARK